MYAEAPPSRTARLFEIVRFGLVGGTTLALYLGLFAILVGSGTSDFTGALVAATLAVALSYLLQRNWTFHSGAPLKRSLPAFLAIHAAGALVNAAIVGFGTGPMALPLAYALVAGAAVYGAFSYLLQKLWCFRA